MDRNELRELRAEFKELGQQPEQLFAARDVFDPQGVAYRREWSYSGPHRQVKQYKALARRAARFTGRYSADGWLDHLAERNELKERIRTKDHIHAVLDSVAELSVLAIDELLALNRPAASPASDPPNGKAGDDQSPDNSAGLSAEMRALAILAAHPKLRSIEEVAKLANCSRQHLSSDKCPTFRAAWAVAQKQTQGKVARGSKSKNGDLEAWK